MKRAAIYLRVSTEDQHLENQRPDLVRMVKTAGFKLSHTFEDKISATKRRPAFERMLEAARRREFDAIFVWALDRFGRSMYGNVALVVELDALGVQLRSWKETWLDTGGPTRNLLIAILSWVAEWERSRLVERTRAGMERARAQGKHIGRRHRLSPRERDQVRAMKREGRSIRGIAVALKCPKSTVARALASHKGIVARSSRTPAPDDES
jgi:putative DNA-invertase from lambdoid prophage Rac